METLACDRCDLVWVEILEGKSVSDLCQDLCYLRKLLMGKMVGATGFESVFATFLIFGCVRYLVTT